MMNKLFFYLLLPFSILYNLITSIRNHLYNINYKPSIHFEIPLIGVGNLSVGGTGKTPMVEYLLERLASKYQLATLSRGYGRKTRGYRLASEKDGADQIGDEPLQIYLKYKNRIAVAVGEERAMAIPFMLAESPGIQAVILDDAFQHRAVSLDLNILLTTYNKPFFKDHLLPAGRLRESRKGAQRADLVVVTKCPDQLSEDYQEQYRYNIQKYAGEVPVFFSKLKYDKPRALWSENQVFSGPIILVAGIAICEPLKEYCDKNFVVKDSLFFSDHHHYSASDFKAIHDRSGGIPILTTEKDMVKWKESPAAAILHNLPVFYLPVQHSFVKNGEEFDQLIYNFARNKINSGVA